MAQRARDNNFVELGVERRTDVQFWLIVCFILGLVKTSDITSFS